MKSMNLSTNKETWRVPHLKLIKIMFINYQTVGLKSGLFSLCVCFLSCWRSNTRFVIRLFFLMKKYFFLTFSYFKYFADQKFSCAVYLQEIMPLKPQRCPGAQIIQLHYSLLKLIMMSSWCHHDVAWQTVYSRMTFLLWDQTNCAIFKLIFLILQK